MSIRTRKFIGTVALLTLVMTWGLLAMALAQSVLTNINGFVAALYYVIAGLGWVLPAMPLISWMSRPEKTATPR
jgi:dipeptide/tripeptide permease